jgi:membrane protein implicated in regulation of membrane protease activity
MEHNDKGRTSGSGIFGLVILKLLCCGLPILFLVLGSAGIGTLFTESVIRWIFGSVAVVILIILIAVFFGRRKRRTGEPDCCTPFDNHAASNNKNSK